MIFLQSKIFINKAKFIHSQSLIFLRKLGPVVWSSLSF
ncbi:MAG: Rop family plasmid primer RNA-binding protein [Acaryochloridaceae cyanobacterium SU_2_1]|nr:Rop family plasmid primer RNA-binding protein [Acaryochloridaceae cyanobacterium SU_2_1]